MYILFMRKIIFLCLVVLLNHLLISVNFSISSISSIFPWIKPWAALVHTTVFGPLRRVVKGSQTAWEIYKNTEYPLSFSKQTFLWEKLEIYVFLFESKDFSGTYWLTKSLPLVVVHWRGTGGATQRSYTVFFLHFFSEFSSKLSVA